MSNSYFCYGIYDNLECRYRYLFTVPENSNSRELAKKQFVGYCVGASDLYIEDLELHSIDRIGSTVGDIAPAFVVVCNYQDVASSVDTMRKAEYKRLHPLE